MKTNVIIPRTQAAALQLSEYRIRDAYLAVSRWRPSYERTDLLHMLEHVMRELVHDADVAGEMLGLGRPACWYRYCSILGEPPRA